MALPIQSTEVSIEALQEYPIQSFQYDGREISTELVEFFMILF